MWRLSSCCIWKNSTHSVAWPIYLTVPYVPLVAVHQRLASNLHARTQLFLSFYRMEVPRIDRSVRIIDSLLKEFFPDLRDHFAAIGVRMDMFLIDWCAGITASSHPLTCV